RINLSVLSLQKVTPCDSLVVDRVAAFLLHPGVNNRKAVKAPLAKLAEQLGGIRKTRLVPREVAVCVHVHGVEKNCVARDMALAEIVGDRTIGTVRVIVRAALQVTKGPTRRQRRPSNELRKPCDDRLGVG